MNKPIIDKKLSVSFPPDFLLLVLGYLSTLNQHQLENSRITVNTNTHVNIMAWKLLEIILFVFCVMYDL